MCLQQMKKFKILKAPISQSDCDNVVVDMAILTKAFFY